MSATTLSRGWIPQTADKMVIGQGELQLEPITEQGLADSLIVESSLERVAVFTHGYLPLTLHDITHMRRVMTRSRARRGVLFVFQDTVVTGPVSLLSGLSKIEIVQLCAHDAALPSHS